MGRKLEGALPLFWGGELGPQLPIYHNVAWAEAYLSTKWHHDPSNRMATIHQQYRQDRQRSDSIGWTVSQTAAQKNTLLRLRGTKCIIIPNFMVIHRTTAKLRLFNSFWATVCKTIRPMLYNRCLPCPVLQHWCIVAKWFDGFQTTKYLTLWQHIKFMRTSRILYCGHNHDAQMWSVNYYRLDNQLTLLRCFMGPFFNVNVQLCMHTYTHTV